MPLIPMTGRLLPLAAALMLGAALAGCSAAGAGLVTSRTQGYEISQDALVQVRPGQSQTLVTTVLGSPMTTNTFGEQEAWYYVQTKVNQTAFGLNMVQDRTVLAVYFDKNKKVVDKAVYTLQDGRAVAIETRRTPSFGEDRTFIESIIKSL